MTSLSCTCKMTSMIEKMTMTYFHKFPSHLSGPRPLSRFPWVPSLVSLSSFAIHAPLEKNVDSITVKNMHNVTHNWIYNSQANITTRESRSCCQTTNCHKRFDSLVSAGCRLLLPGLVARGMVLGCLPVMNIQYIFRSPIFDFNFLEFNLFYPIIKVMSLKLCYIYNF
jgi:hypothetical protein